MALHPRVTEMSSIMPCSPLGHLSVWKTLLCGHSDASLGKGWWLHNLLWKLWGKKILP